MRRKSGAEVALNRTILELKFATVKSFITNPKALNRTILELK